MNVTRKQVWYTLTLFWLGVSGLIRFTPRRLLRWGAQPHEPLGVKEMLERQEEIGRRMNELLQHWPVKFAFLVAVYVFKPILGLKEVGGGIPEMKNEATRMPHEDYDSRYGSDV